MKTFDKVMEFVQEIPIIDSHEHICEEEKVGPDPDILRTYLQHYITVDVISAGLTWDDFHVVMDTSRPILERWDRLDKHWENARLTGYAQALDLAVQKIYDEERIDRSTIERLSVKFKEANKPGHYHHVLHDLCNIEVSVNDMINGMQMTDSPLFKFVGRVDPIIEPKCMQDFQNLGNQVGVRVHTLEDYEELLEKYIDKIIADGQIGLKCAVAYRRPLFFEKVSRARAEDAFLRMVRGEDCSNADVKAFQDFVMHRICALAEKRHMFMQVHTGILEGNGNYIPNSNPMQLSNLIHEYTGLRFDLFHIGYPYHDQMGAMVKMYPNAYADLAWANIVSPAVSRRVLSDWLETMPANKIIGFGGDYCFVDGVYGHQLIARRNLSYALAEKVDMGLMDMKRAKRVAQMILHDNGKAVYGL